MDTGLLGLFFTASVPAAIQQGHFFIVDGFITTIAPYAVIAVAWAVQSGERSAYIPIGVTIGGVALGAFNWSGPGLVLLAGLLARADARAREAGRAGDIAFRAGAAIGAGAAALSRPLANLWRQRLPLLMVVANNESWDMTEVWEPIPALLHIRVLGGLLGKESWIAR